MSSNLPNTAALNTQWLPPDGGWGWIIVLAYAMCNIVITPCVGNFGLIFADKFTAMHLSATDISLITNVNAAFAMSMGLISGALLRRFGYRKVGFVAGCLVAGGMVATAFARTFSEFLVFYGLITAAGFGLAVSAFSLALNSYFLEKRNRAVGISMTLTGFGPIFYPYLISVWKVEYGVTGCVLLLGAICLHIVVAALLLHPVRWHQIHRSKAIDVELEILPAIGSTVNEAATVACNRSFCTIQTDHKHHQRINADHCVDAQSIYGIDQMTIIRNPSYGGRSILLSTATSAKSVRPSPDKFPINSGDPRFERSISHVLQRSLSHTHDSPLPSPSLSKPQLRWFETASVDTVNLGSSVDVFSEEGRRVSAVSTVASINPVMSNSRAGTISRHAVSPQPDSTVLDPQPSKTSFCTWIVDFFDLTLFRDLIYVNIMFGMSLAVFAELNFSILTPFIFNDLAYTTPQIASFLSLLAVADIASRFLAPFVGDRIRQPPRIMYMISMVMLISARMTVFVVSGYRSMLVVCVALGIAKGVRTVYMQLVIPSHVPIERLASAAGLQMVVNGLVIMSLGPFVGLIRDWTGSYTNCILFINAITSVTLVMWTVEYIFRNREPKRDSKKSQHLEIVPNMEY